jgi:hypothetical protein
MTLPVRRGLGVRGPGLAQRRTFAVLRVALGRIRLEIASMLQDDPIASAPDRPPAMDHAAWPPRNAMHESRGRPPDFGDTVPTYAHPNDLPVGTAASMRHQHR